MLFWCQKKEQVWNHLWIIWSRGLSVDWIRYFLRIFLRKNQKNIIKMQFAILNVLNFCQLIGLWTAGTDYDQNGKSQVMSVVDGQIDEAKITALDWRVEFEASMQQIGQKAVWGKFEKHHIETKKMFKQTCDRWFKCNHKKKTNPCEGKFNLPLGKCYL